MKLVKAIHVHDVLPIEEEADVLSIIVAHGLAPRWLSNLSVDGCLEDRCQGIFKLTDCFLIRSPESLDSDWRLSTALREHFFPLFLGKHYRRFGIESRCSTLSSCGNECGDQRKSKKHCRSLGVRLTSYAWTPPSHGWWPRDVDVRTAHNVSLASLSLRLSPPRRPADVGLPPIPSVDNHERPPAARGPPRLWSLPRRQPERAGICPAASPQSPRGNRPRRHGHQDTLPLRTRSTTSRIAATTSSGSSR